MNKEMKRNMMTLCVMIIVAILTVALVQPAFAATTTNTDKTMIADNQVATDQPSVNADSPANTDQSATNENQMSTTEKRQHKAKIAAKTIVGFIVIGTILGIGIPKR